MSILTPLGSEADALDYLFDQCDVLFWMAAHTQMSDEAYCKMATRLDDEGVGHYYRALCNWELFPKEPHPLLTFHPLAPGWPVRARSPLAPDVRPRRKGPA